MRPLNRLAAQSQTKASATGPANAASYGRGSRSRSAVLLSVPALIMGLTSPLLMPLLPATALAQQGDFDEEELVSLDFADVELPVVVDTISRMTGYNFIYDDRVRGRVTIVSPTEVTIDQAFAVFESVLKRFDGFARKHRLINLNVLAASDRKRQDLNVQGFGQVSAHFLMIVVVNVGDGV